MEKLLLAQKIAKSISIILVSYYSILLIIWFIVPCGSGVNQCKSFNLPFMVGSVFLFIIVYSQILVYMLKRDIEANGEAVIKNYKYTIPILYFLGLVSLLPLIFTFFGDAIWNIASNYLAK